MSSTGWVVLGVVVVVGLAVVWRAASSRRRARQLEVRRDAAAAHREEAEARERAAESVRLEAEEQAARPNGNSLKPKRRPPKRNGSGRGLRNITRLPMRSIGMWSRRIVRRETPRRLSAPRGPETSVSQRRHG